MAYIFAYLIGGPADQTKRVLKNHVHALRVAELPASVEGGPTLMGMDHDAWCHIHEYYCVYVCENIAVYLHKDTKR